MAPSILGLASAILGIPTITTFIQNLISALTRNSEYIENVQCTRNQLQEFEDEDLLDKMSILLTPTGYSDGSLNVVIPPYEPIYTENVPFVTSEWVNLVEGWSIDETNRKLVAEATWTGTNKRAQYSISEIQIGKTVKFSFDAVVTAGKFHFLEPFPSGDVGYGSPNFINQSGSYSFTFVATGSSVYFRNKSTDFAGEITNIRVEVIEEANFDFSRGSSATRVNEQGLVEDVQILSGELVQNGNFEEIGNELVTNGNFETDSDWTKDSGWSIENGQAVCDGVGINSLQQSGITTTGKIYKLSFDVLDSNNFNFLVISTNFADTYVDADSNNSVVIGTNTFYIKPTNGTGIRFRVANGATLSIDNVSVKEVAQNWTPNANATLSIDSGRLKVAISGGSGYPSQSITTEVGKTYKVTADAFIGTSSRLAFWTNADSQFRNLYADGSFNFTFVATSTSTQLRLYVYDDGAYGFWDNVSVVKVTNDTDLPRIDYSPYSGAGTCGHLLLEPQRTNTFVYSEDYSQSNWIKNEITATANSIVSPDGSVNASLITIASTVPYLGQLQFLTTGTNYTISAFVKKGTNRWVRLAFVSSGVTAAWFDLENNVVGNQSINSVSASIENYGNGWYRIINTFTAQQGSGNAFLGLSDANNGTSSPSGIGNTVYAWGLQIEQGDYATSYIPTNGSAVTRSAETANNSGNADLFNDSEGVLYAEIAALANDGTFRSISISSDAGYNNSIMIRYINTPNQVNVITRIGSAINNTSVNVNDITEFNKIAFKYKSEDCVLFINGVQVATSAGAFNSSGINNLSFDRGGGSANFYGKTKALAVFKEALSNDLLERLTGEGYESFRILAEANNYTII